MLHATPCVTLVQVQPLHALPALLVNSTPVLNATCAPIIASNVQMSTLAQLVEKDSQFHLLVNAEDAPLLVPNATRTTLQNVPIAQMDCSSAAIVNARNAQKNVYLAVALLSVLSVWTAIRQTQMESVCWSANFLVLLVLIINRQNVLPALTIRTLSIMFAFLPSPVILTHLAKLVDLA